MGQQHEVLEALSVGARLDRQGDTAELGQPFLVLAAERQRHQPGAGRQHRVAELACDLIAETGGTHAGNRQPAGGDHQRGAMEQAVAGVYAEAVAAVLDALHAAVGTDLHASRLAFVHQHLHDLLGRDIAEQLAQLLLVVGDAVLADQLDEMPGRVAGQRRLAEVRVGRQEVGRGGAGVGEVAAATARHQDLLADLVGMVDHLHLAAALAGGDRSHQPGRAGADDHYIAADPGSGR
ncbi:hypothetical protein G6F59_014581 [Rhizopus arrhizus]|nr:hypothetical protein G6F59_014581 [Rhizopus arrhizus]